MRILVTGGAGNIATAFIDYISLANSSIEIWALDNFSTTNYGLYSSYSNQNVGRFLNLNLGEMDLESVEEMKDFDYIFHFAAFTDMSNVIQFNNTLENNCKATRSIARYATKFNIPMLFTSTTSVQNIESKSFSNSEKSIKSHNPYIQSKLQDEAYLYKLSKKFGLKYVILRLGTLHGVSRTMKFHTAVNKFCKQAYFGEPITVWNTAKQTFRPYLAMSDLVYILRLFIDGVFDFGEIYNITSHHLQISNVIDLISKYKKIQINYIDEQRMTAEDLFVDTFKISNKGVQFYPNLEQDILDTFSYLESKRIKND